MKFTTTPIALKAAVNAVSSVVQSKNTMPVLENILFQPSTDRQTFNVTATDNDLTVTYPLPIDEGEDLVPFMMPAKMLCSYINSVITDLPLTIVVNKNEVSISDVFSEGYDSNFRFAIDADTSAYPLQKPLADGYKQFDLPVERLRNAIISAANYCSTDDLRPVMQGVYADFQASLVTIAASDSKKLFREHISLDNTGLGEEEHFGVIIPGKMISIIKHVIKASEPLVFGCDGKAIRIQQGDVVVYCRCIEGRYPRYEAIIPRNNNRVAVVNRRQLLSSISRVLIAANSSTQCIALEFDGVGSVGLEAQDIDVSTHAKLRIPTVEQHNSDIRIGMRGSYLKDIIEKSFTCDQVRISMLDPTRAVTITSLDNDDRLCLLMPMQLVDF